MKGFWKGEGNMRAEEEIRKEMERCMRERDNSIAYGHNEIANILNARYWALKWALKES
jgi:hypothetical protein